MVPSGGEATQAPAHNVRMSDSQGANTSAAVWFAGSAKRDFFKNALSNPDRRQIPAGNAACCGTVLLQATKADLHGLSRSITTRLEPDSIWRQLIDSSPRNEVGKSD
jgi:hypothetical protein